MKRWLPLILVLVFVGSSMASAGEKSMARIAVASEGKNITEPVGFRMGQSSFYLLFDGQGKFLEAVDNPFKNAGGNAAGRSGKSALDSLRVDEKGGLTGGVETVPKEERDKIWSLMLGFLTSKGITVVVAEQFGFEIVRALKEKGINCLEFKGSSIDAVKRVQQTANKTE